MKAERTSTRRARPAPPRDGDDGDDAARLVRIAKALGDPTRFEIFRTIAAAGELSCGEVAERFSIAQATVSHHLKVLVDAGLVASRRDGQHSHFRLMRRSLDDYRRALRRIGAG